MTLRLRRCTLYLVLLSLPAIAAPPGEDRHAARIRASSSRPESADVPPSEAAPIAAAAADAGGIDLAGFLGMLTALGTTFVYARGRRLARVARELIRPSVGTAPLDPR